MFGDYQKISPTCTEYGGTRRVCTVCGYVEEMLEIEPLGHDFVVTSRKDATCTEDGFEHYACSRCGADGGTEPLPATGHKFGDWQTVPATCTEGGYAYHTCTVCGATERARETAALGHAWDNGTVTTQPTCTQEGVRTYTCTRDASHTYTESIAKTAHTPVTIPAVAATCTAGGKTEGSKCSVCGAILTAQTDTPALGHSWDGGKVTTQPTCTQEGVRTYTCTRDASHTYTEPIAKTAHTPVTVPGKAATCTEPGLTEGSKCSVCGAVLTAQQTIPATGHNYQVTASKEPTATEDGYRTYTCTNCKDTYTEVLPKVAHTHNYQVTRDQPATCTDQGSKTYTCSICGESYTETTPALGHTWGPWQPGEPANCTEYGTRYHDCSRCGAREWERDYSALGDHVWGPWTTVKEPTATEPGLEQRVCQIDASHVEQREIPPTGEPAAEPKPSLSVKVMIAPGEEKESYADDDPIVVRTALTNTGNVTLYYADYYTLPSTNVIGAYTASLAPGESTAIQHEFNVVDNNGGSFKVGRVAVAFTDPADAGDYDTLAAAQARASAVTSNEDWLVVPLAEKEIKPAMDVIFIKDENAGNGKRYEGAIVEYSIYMTNTGNCPLYTHYQNSMVVSCTGPSGPVDRGVEYVMMPGESSTRVVHHVVKGYEEIDGKAFDGWYLEPEYITQNGNRSTLHVAAGVSIYLTYPDGEGPEAKKPSLELIDRGVVSYKGGNLNDENGSKDVYGFDDGVFNRYTLINNGNVPLDIYIHYKAEGVKEYDSQLFSEWGPPAKHLSDRGGSPIGKFVTPGTGTAELEGIANISFYFVGCDPDTGEELCRTQTISNAWKVAKPGPSAWEIPEESAMKVGIIPYYSSTLDPADPAGYQLGEEWGPCVYFQNVGNVVLDEYSLYMSCVADSYGFDGGDELHWPAGKGHLEPGEINNRWYSSPMGIITEKDVERGYVMINAYVTWRDPDSGIEHTAYAEPCIYPVISKTGLLVKKGIAQAPANGSYFVEGEQVQWAVTVTNNSKEPMRNVTVTDQGVTIGTFAEIAAGETKTCAVPAYTVTEYDAGVGYVSNSAKAVGTNLKGAELTYDSNTATVPTSADSPVPLPPILGPDGSIVPPGGPGESGGPGSGPLPETPTHPGTPGGGTDPLSPIYGLNVAATIYKTDAIGPANGDYYELNDQITYTITVKNTGDVALENVRVVDSLGGLSPIGTAASLAPGAELPLTFTHTVTEGDISTGYVVNTAMVSYEFGGGTPGTPITSNAVYSKAGENGYIPGEGAPGGGIDGLTPGGGSSFDPTLLPVPGPGLTPVIGPDGLPVTSPDGHPIYTDGHGGYYIVGPDGHLIVTDEHGIPVTGPFGGYVYPDGEGGFYTLGPDGGYIKCDKDGNPILDENGNYIYMNGIGPVSCEYRLDALGENEAHYTLHACAEHTEAALAAEAAAAAGTAEGWQQAADIWREEVGKLYQVLLDAANADAKAAVINDWVNLSAYLGAYQAMRAGDDPAAVQQAVAEMLRMHCAELCAMVHTLPSRLPDSLMGEYASMMDSAAADATTRTIAPMSGSDSDVTETYHAAYARTLGEVLDTVRGTGSAGLDNAFLQAQRQWQIALDGVVNAAYKAAPRDSRKPIVGWRTMLDQYYTARKALMDLVYADAPEVGNEILMNLYKNAAVEAAQTFAK